MKEEMIKRKQAILSKKIFPWFIGFSDDLMFCIVINTLFFTVVKQLSGSQITFLTTISALSYIILQKPFLAIIKRIGNTYAVRIGVMMLLIGSILLTFGNSYAVLMIGHIFYSVSFIFKSMAKVLIKNNLIYLNEEDSFIQLENRAHIIYSIVTLVFALTAGYIFNFNHYLPMYLCMAVCVMNVIMSMKMVEVYEPIQETNEKTIKRSKQKLSKIILMVILSYGILYSTISMGQQNVKLFIQYQLQDCFDVTMTAKYLGYILAFSRIARLVGNLSFSSLYQRWKDKLNIILSVIGVIAFSLVALSNCFSIIFIRFTIMTIGFCFILAIRDVFTTYIQDLLLKHADSSQQQTGISYLGLSRKIGETSLSFLFSMMLLKIDIFYVVLTLIGFAIIGLAINVKLYKKILEENRKIKQEGKGEKVYAN